MSPSAISLADPQRIAHQVHERSSTFAVLPGLSNLWPLSRTRSCLRCIWCLRIHHIRALRRRRCRSYLGLLLSSSRRARSNITFHGMRLHCPRFVKSSIPGCLNVMIDKVLTLFCRGSAFVCCICGNAIRYK